MRGKGIPLPASSKTLRNELHSLWIRAGLRRRSEGKPQEVKPYMVSGSCSPLDSRMQE